MFDWICFGGVLMDSMDIASKEEHLFEDLV
jgi:hypothetical protein